MGYCIIIFKYKALSAKYIHNRTFPRHTPRGSKGGGVTQCRQADLYYAQITISTQCPLKSFQHWISVWKIALYELQRGLKTPPCYRITAVSGCRCKIVCRVIPRWISLRRKIFVVVLVLDGCLSYKYWTFRVAWVYVDDCVPRWLSIHKQRLAKNLNKPLNIVGSL